jgi:malonate transporter and related proteins
VSFTGLLGPLAAVYAGVAAGFVLGRLGWPEAVWQAVHRALGRTPGVPLLRSLSDLTFLVFIPILLFRTTARIEVSTLPWPTLAAYFVPAATAQLLWARWQRRRAGPAGAAPEGPAVWAFTATFGNSVQLGIPMASALFGDRGLALHLALVAVHALVLLTLATLQAEWARARVAASSAGGRPVRQGIGTVVQTARRALIHPVVLPVLAGLGFNALGGTLAPAVDDALRLVGAVAIPLCLVLIGLTLAAADARAAFAAAIGPTLAKLMGLPALVWVVAQAGFGVAGWPLWVLVMAATLPAGANALLFAQRYRVAEADTAGVVVTSTLLFAVTAPLWLMLLALWAPGGPAPTP